jgi:DNA-binding transcriptional MerR regulator
MAIANDAHTPRPSDTPPAPQAVVQTIAKASALLGVNPRTLYEWVEKPGFPGRVGSRGRADGHFPIAEIKAWRAGIEAESGRDGGTKAQTQKSQQIRGDLLEIKRIRELAELERETLGTLVDAAEVASFLQQTITTATAQLGELGDRIDAALPDRVGPKLRKVVRRVVRKVLRETLATIAELSRGDKDDEESGVDE